MHNLPIDYIAASLLILAVLQGLSLFLKNLEVAARQIESQSTWTAPDGTVFEEVSLHELETSQVMLHDYEQTRTGSFGPVRLTLQANG